MRPAILYSAAALAACTSASPIFKWGGSGNQTDFKDFTPNLPDGFPNPNPDQIKDIENRAHGTLPNSPLPTNLSKAGINNFRLIAFNELFETAYFFELVQNVTNNVEGYQMGSDQDRIIENLKVVLAVEELHAIGANAILAANKVEPIKPCKYNFPVSDFKSAINLAGTFTDVVLGTLQDANTVFSQNGDHGPVHLISSIIGQEGQQEGLFRVFQKKATPSQPFLTSSAADFAFTAIQSFVVPGSCPNIQEIPLKTFKPLNVLTQNIEPKTQKLKFSFSMKEAIADPGQLSLVYINAQNTPIVKPLENVKVDQYDPSTVTFSADFPFDEFLLHGLTIAAVTQSQGPFADADAVADAAIFGPGLIEVN